MLKNHTQTKGVEMKKDWTLSNQAKAELAKNNLEVGCRIFYGGDMANNECRGTILGIDASRWGINLEIKLDDNRTLNISPTHFSKEYKGHGGTRFVTLAAYNEYRNAQLRAMGYNDAAIHRYEAK